MTQKHNCPKCPFRATYDKKPSSLLGKLWRWHTNWCPGWKSYMTSLAEEDRKAIAGQYEMKKYL